MTMTVTPVLADQLEDDGGAGAAAAVPGRVADRRRRGRRRARGAARVPRGLRGRAGPLPARAGAARRRRRRPAARLPARRRRRAGSRLPPPRRPTRCCRCWRRARGCGLQLDAGIRSHRRRFGWDGGFWLPECAYAPGLEWRLAEQGVSWFCVDQSAHEEPLDALSAGRDRGRAGGAADRLGGDPAGSGRSTATPPTRPTPSSPANRCAACGSGRSAAAPTTRPRPRRRRAARPASSSPRSPPACASSPPRASRRGLLVFAIDTELLGHWWSEGAIWLREVLAGRRGGGGAAAHRARGARRARAGRAAARRLDLGRGQGPAHLGLARGRRPRLGRAAAGAAAAAGALRGGLRGDAAPRAARELLAAQASDWAFLDKRGQAGDYAFQRATGHAEAALEAIDSPAITDPRMRSLAPDLSLAPLLEP